jgi:hypothetical protein
MPALYLATGRTAGEECSSTYEGRHITIEEQYLIHPYHSDGLVDKGDPVLIDDGVSPCIVGVAFSSAAAATDLIAIDTEGIWYLDVFGRVSDGTSDGVALALGAGDPVGIMVTPGVNTVILTGESDWSHFRPFGFLLGDVTASTTAETTVAVKVHNDFVPQNGRLDFGSGSTAAGNMLLEGSTTLRRSVAIRGCFAPETLLTAGEQIHGINFRIVDNLVATGGEITCAEFKAVRDDATDATVSSATALKVNVDDKNGASSPYNRGIDIMMEGVPGAAAAIRSGIHFNSGGTAGTLEGIFEIEDGALGCVDGDPTGGGGAADHKVAVIYQGALHYFALYNS